MGITERVWAALTSMIKLEDKVVRQGEIIKSQQTKIENLTERLIKLETTIELLIRARELKRVSDRKDHGQRSNQQHHDSIIGA